MSPSCERDILLSRGTYLYVLVVRDVGEKDLNMERVFFLVNVECKILLLMVLLCSSDS